MIGTKFTWAIALSATMLLQTLRSASAQERLHPEINWLSDPHLAAQIAGEHNLPIVVYVTASGCGYCRQMERQTWSHSQVVHAVHDKYVALKLTSERHPQLVERLKVQAFPTTFLLGSKLNYHSGVVGFQSPREMTELLQHLPPAVARLDQRR